MSTIEITTKIGCKVACLYCPQKIIIEAYSKRSNIMTMEFETFKICLKKIPKSYYIVFSGFCEPWLNPDCLRMIQYADQSGYRISLFTTLLGIHEENIEHLERIPFETFWVHLPSGNNEENINVDSKYLAVLDKLIRSKISASYHIHGEKIHPKINLPSEIIVIKESICSRSGNIDINSQFSLFKKHGKLSCIRGLQQNILLPNGEIALCCMDYGLKHILGNLLDSNFESLYLSDEYKKIKRGLKIKSVDIICRYCNCTLTDNLFKRFQFLIKKKVNRWFSKDAVT